MRHEPSPLERYLREVNPAALVGLVDLVKGEVGARKLGAPADAAAKILSDPANAERVVAALPREARHFFFRLLDRGGIARVEDFLRDTAATEPKDMAKTSWSTHAQFLAQRGLLLAVSFKWIPLYYQPTHLRDYFAPLLAAWQRERDNGRADYVPNPSLAVPVGTMLGPVIAALTSRPMRLTRSRTPFRKHADAFDTLFGRSHLAAWSAFDALHGLGLTLAKEDHVVVECDEVERFSKLGPIARAGRMIQALFERWPLAFNALALTGREGERWVRIDRLQTKLDVAGLIHGWAGASARGRPISSQWAYDLRIAAGLGVFDLAGSDDRIEAARTSEHARAHIRGDVDPPTKSVSRPLIVQPNFEVFVSADASLIDWMRLGRFANLATVDAISRFTIDAGSARRVASAGENAESAIAFLHARALHAVPQNVEATLRSWIDHAGAVRLDLGLVVRVSDERLTTRLRGMKGREIAPGIFVFNERREAEVRKVLGSFGHRDLPLLEKERYPIDEDVEPYPTPAMFVMSRLEQQMKASETLRVDPSNAAPSGASREVSVRDALTETFGWDRAEKMYEQLHEDEIVRIGKLILEHGMLYAAHEAARLVSSRPYVPKTEVDDPEAIRRCLQLLAERDDDSSVKIEYITKGLPPRKHTISPIDLFARGGYTYVEAYDVDSDEIRLFDLSRIFRLIMTPP